MTSPYTAPLYPTTGQQKVWMDHYTGSQDPNAAQLKVRLMTKLESYTHLGFDFIEVAVLGKKACVFVAKGQQSTVLYCKTKGFPSAKLLAQLTLLGS